MTDLLAKLEEAECGSLARGSQKKPDHGVRFTVRMDGRLDRETFEQVRDYAKTCKCSVSEAIRLLVEFGLETAQENGQ